MKRILFMLSGGYGPFVRLLPIMDALRDRGHLVAFTAIDAVSTRLESYGYRRVHVPWISHQENDRNPPLTPLWSSPEHFWAMSGYNDRVWIRKLWAAYYAEASLYRPDVIIGDVSVEANVTAKMLNVPFISVTQACFHPEIKNKRIRWWEPEKQLSCSVLSEVNDVLSGLDLTEINRFDDLFVGDITIIPSFPEFDEIDFSSEVIYVGPILPVDAPASLDISFEHQDRPLLFVYAGRLKDFVGMSGLLLWQLCLEHLVHLKVNITISHGGVFALHEDVNSLYGQLVPSALPNNVRVVDWIPPAVAYSNSTLAIHHGGHGSCMATFYYGKPSLVIPTHSEREYNARALERLGVGLMCPFRGLTGTRLIDMVEDILQHSCYLASANRWCHELASRHYGGAGQVAELTERLLH